MKGEAIEYQFENIGNALPPKFKISYKGAFPVYIYKYNAFDFKGVIAINEKTLRASEQTKWYPVIYDIKNDRLINSYMYKLAIKITNGNTVFVNGSPPQKGDTLNFESVRPHPLLIFAGTYDFIESNGDYILNANITEDAAERVFENIDSSSYAKISSPSVIFKPN